MLSIFICEDTQIHRDKIRKCVESCITIHNLDMKIAMATDDPRALIEYIKSHPGVGLYFLDIDLENEVDGFELAESIREHDPRGFIVFITTHGESLPVVFKYKLEAMDFIIKDNFFDLQTKIEGCIFNAQKKYAAKMSEVQKFFTFKSNEKMVSVAYDKILYFESSSNRKHMVKLYATNGVYEFYSTLKDLLKTLDKCCFKCHQSYIINTKQDMELNVPERTVFFKQGYTCPVSKRNLAQLIKLIENADK